MLKGSRIDSNSPPLVGWREWLGLPDLDIERVKAKIDTGARSSSLHAFDLQEFRRGNRTWIQFSVHPLQHSAVPTITTEAPLIEYRKVRSSSGHWMERPVILTTIDLGGFRWPIELTLSSRDEMGFRMLLGRSAVRNRFLVHSGQSYLHS